MVGYVAPPTFAPGVSERGLAKGTGLRQRSWRVLAGTNITRFTAATAMATTTPFTLVAVTGLLPGFGQTPVVRVVQSFPGVFSLRVRVAGYDQFGEYQVETSPVCPIEAKTNNYIYLSRVFSVVTACSYAEATPTSGATISFGIAADPKKLVDATNAHYAVRNHGYGVPLFMPASQGYGVVAAAKGAAAAAMVDPCVGLSVMNQTTFQEWFVKPGGLEVGANVSGWPGANDKFGIVDWSKVVRSDGAAADYAPGDLVTYHITARTRL